MSTVWLMGCLLAIITSTPYRGDDLLNKDIRDVVDASGRTLFGFTSSLTEDWMVSSGRLFPGALSWTYSLFWAFDSRVNYKIAIGLVTIAAIAMLSLFVARLTGRWKTAAIFVPIAFALIQVRTMEVGITSYDGIISYAGLLPLTAGLSVAAVVIVISRRGIGWATLAALLYSLALVTYETVFVFAPVMVGVVVWSRRAWRPGLAILIPAIGQLALTMYLRTQLSASPPAAYTINLEPKTVILTFAKQVLAAVPFSQWVLSSSVVPTITIGSIVIGLLAAGIPTFLSIAALGQRHLRSTTGEIVAIAAFGAWIWLSSSALVAVTLRWQLELTRGQGYLSVVYGYFGFALCLLSAYLVVDRIVADRSPVLLAAWRYGSASLIAVVASLTLAANIAITSI